MLTKASSRFGSGLSNLQTSSSCTRRCAPTSTALLSQPRLQGTNPRPNRSTLKHHLLSPTPRSSTSQLLRCASTSAASPQAPSTTSPATTTTTSPQTTTISWNDYLALRKTRRRYNLIASIFTSLGTTSLGVTVLSRQNFDQLGGLFGLDPFIVLGLATASSGAVGWLLGPFVGNALFGMVHRKVGRQIAEVSDEVFCPDETSWHHG